MPTIHLTTFIAAPAKKVFDLSRSIQLHKKSMTNHKEEAIAGTISGLINLNETVTWKAHHLWKTRMMKVRITEMQSPVHFIDEMVEGDFKAMKHEHHFKEIDNGTILIDLFQFESPYGIIGRIFNKVYLTGYLKRMLEKRNKMIKDFAESNQWQQVLQ